MATAEMDPQEVVQGSRNPAELGFQSGQVAVKITMGEFSPPPGVDSHRFTNQQKWEGLSRAPGQSPAQGFPVRPLGGWARCRACSLCFLASIVLLYQKNVPSIEEEL